MEELKAEILKEFDFDYFYQLNRVKSAELEVADFEECGEELKQKISQSLSRIEEASAREAVKENKRLNEYIRRLILEIKSTKNTVKELRNLYGTPICDNLHHKNIHQHKGIEPCPVTTEIHRLLTLQDNK